jgi:hypothetical protein
LRLLSNELNFAIVVLSQVNEDGKSRESRALEHDCTAIWKLLPCEGDAKSRFLAIPYQREGESGIQFPLTFLGHLASFENFSGKDEPEPDQPKKKRRRNETT